MIPKPLDQIEESDLQELVDDDIQESKDLEYKEYLDPSGNSSHKTTLLAEVTSFANSQGGDLIVGIVENNGVPQSLGGIPLSQSPDQLVETWGNILRRQTEPKLPTTAYDIEVISLSSGRHAVVVRVERSWQSPHRVRTNDKFYGRHASGKFPMTVGELRDQIIAAESLQEELKEFRADRITECISGDTPIPLPDGPKLLFHLVPHDAFTLGDNVDLAAADATSDSSPPMFVSRGRTGSWGDRYMVDSVTQFLGARDSDHSYYVRVFRNGAIEAYTNAGFNETDSGVPYLLAEFVTSALERVLPEYLSFLDDQDIRPPFYTSLSLIDAAEFTLLQDQEPVPPDTIPFERQVLQFPFEVIETYNEDLDDTIADIETTLWNAAGRRDSSDYP